MAIPRKPFITADPASDKTGFRLPIVEQHRVELDGMQRARIEGLAVEIKERDPRLISTAAFGPRVSSGLGPGPNLVLEDHSSIALYNPEDDRRYTYRAMMLAGDGDVLALAADRNPAFESYCRDTLALGRVEVRIPEACSPPVPLALRCLRDSRFLEGMARLADEHRGLNLLPYLGDGKAWALARAIARRSEAEVRVAAGPPGLTRCVNDKLWFEARVDDVLGRGALPEVRLANGPALLAYHVKSLAGRYASVAIKIPASASSTGNIVLESAEVAGRPLTPLREELCSLLTRTGWRGDFPLMVTAWEQPILASPSVQVWIPHSSENLPIIEGIFEQNLAGRKRVFVGASPCELSSTVRRQLATETLQLAYLLQCLGYFGRCSFDAILLNDGKTGSRTHWVECNGRWGGVSIPMTLINRILGNWQRRPFVIAQRSHLRARGRPFADVVHSLGERLFVAGKREEGVIVLTPGPLEAGTGYDLIVLADSAAAVQEMARDATTSLL
ncbi:MAG: hypothetical protein QNJ30_16860 [Kiloniellales bacterium]|nr:hypothetical protein [Kiloniellales bacterium]